MNFTSVKKNEGCSLIFIRRRYGSLRRGGPCLLNALLRQSLSQTAWGSASPLSHYVFSSNFYLSPQFLCLKNIRTFLSTCCEKFGLKRSELFEAFDLFDVQDFGKVSCG